MPLKVLVAHDFICPWCWVGLFQAKRLAQEEGVIIEYRSFELWPEELAWPTPSTGPAPAVDQRRPKTPTRFEFMLATEGMTMPVAEKPQRMRTHNAHEALLLAKAHGREHLFIEALYRAYWERGENINDPAYLCRMAPEFGLSPHEMMAAIHEKKYAREIIGFDNDAYNAGVYNVPTFFIGAQRLAEQPYTVLQEAVKEAKTRGDVGPYQAIAFPTAPTDRPYTFIDMVSTIDGKTVSGSRTDSVNDLGSKVDHMTLRRLEASADAVLLGAGTYRATPYDWVPRSPRRIVVSNSGDIDFSRPFFTQPGAIVATSGSATIGVPSGVELLRAGSMALDPYILMQRLRGLGVERLLVLGGSETNGELLRRGLVDELFLTIAPKIKLGRDLPTYAGGDPLGRENLLNFELVEHHPVGNELFVRYRRA
jgi:riboflavin biosynthesis pyrimidine reductase/predicted DsbA family dithiol-disulfide isomerase